MSGSKLDVRVAFVETDFKADKNDGHGRFAKVVFRVRAFRFEWDLPVYVERAGLDGGEIIPVARRRFRQMLRDLGESTEGWGGVTGEARQPPPGNTGRGPDPT